MGENDKNRLQERIRELEGEVQDREKDLARYRDELLKANRKIEKLIEGFRHEIKLAHAIQKTLVPTEFPHISGFEFSTKFIPSALSGGDYFDIFEHEDKFRFGVVLSSASGHGLSALFLSVLLKMTGQLESRKGSEPHSVVGTMAQEMMPNMEPGAESDLFYALIDRRNFEMRFVRLGSVIGLLQIASTGEVQLLESSTGPIASEFTAPKSSHKVYLNPRDRVVLCTRGLTEVKNLDGESFGVERVMRGLLSGPKRGVHELRNHLLYEVQKFAQGQELARDVTVLVLEVKDKVIKLAKT